MAQWRYLGVFSMDKAGPKFRAWQAVTAEDEVITAKCDLDMGRIYKDTVFNFAQHRRPEAYTLITERAGAILPE